MSNTDSSSIMDEALAEIFGDDDIRPDGLIFNQRFKKLCRLKQVGIYVDEAHHLFGKELEKELRKGSDTSLRSTINLLASELERNGSSVVAFHADTYCFDSKPEKECFLQYITNFEKVQEIYFTGMFTSNQGDLSIPYYDPETQRMRNYYPDFLAKMSDGTYQLIEVKGDNMIDDIVVKAKKSAAEEIAAESKMEYIIYKGSTLMNNNVLSETSDCFQATFEQS